MHPSDGPGSPNEPYSGAMAQTQVTARTKTRRRRDQLNPLSQDTLFIGVDMEPLRPGRDTGNTLRSALLVDAMARPE